MDHTSISGQLIRALAVLTKETFRPEFSNGVTVCTERMIAPRKEPYFFIQALENEAYRSFPGFLITCKVVLQYCIPQPAEGTDYELMMTLAEKMEEILRVVVIQEDVLAVWGKDIRCTADAKGISATALFTMRREALNLLKPAASGAGGEAQ